MTTPTGWRTSSAPRMLARPIGPASVTCGGSPRSTGSRAPFAYRLKRVTPTPTCMPRAIPVGAPVSARASAVHGSNSRCMMSAARSRIAARSSGFVRDQLPKASAAARAASSTWAREASGASPTTDSSAGSITS